VIVRKALPYVLGALVLLGVGAVIALVAGGGGDGDKKSTVSHAAATTATAGTSTASGVGAADQISTGEDTRAYREQVRSINGRLNATAGKLPKVRQFGTPAFSSAVLSIARETSAIADDLGRLAPPAQVASQHAALLRQLQVLEDNYRRLRRANNARDPGASAAALGAVSAALTRVDKAITRILTRL
jgi:hypothetical protein